MAAVHSDFPGIHLPLRLGTQILNCSVVLIVAKKVNGHDHSARKVNGHKIERKREVEKDEEEPRSAWEPSSPYESSRCKALLLEVLRRAAHDWVLYRSHARLANREIAQDAYEWLFEEDEEHVSWRERSTAVFTLDDGEEVTGVRNITSFLSICEVLELDPETVRARVRQMDVQTIISAGRPAETRKVKSGEMAGIEECGVMIGVDVNAMPSDRQYETQYESYGSVATPESLSLNDISGLY